VGYYAIPDALDQPLETLVNPVGMQVDVRGRAGWGRREGGGLGSVQGSDLATTVTLPQPVNPPAPLATSTPTSGAPAAAQQAARVEQGRWPPEAHCVAQQEGAQRRQRGLPGGRRCSGALAVPSGRLSGCPSLSQTQSKHHLPQRTCRPWSHHSTHTGHQDPAVCTLPGAESTFCTLRLENAHLGQGATISRDTSPPLQRGPGSALTPAAAGPWQCPHPRCLPEMPLLRAPPSSPQPQLPSLPPPSRPPRRTNWSWRQPSRPAGWPPACLQPPRAAAAPASVAAPTAAAAAAGRLPVPGRRLPRRWVPAMPRGVSVPSRLGCMGLAVGGAWSGRRPAMRGRRRRRAGSDVRGALLS
jgi:hypothetical protein